MSEEISNRKTNISEKKKCFIITPIGDDSSDIRRHIDGIIDQSVIPAIGDKYEIDVAHRKYEIGSINDRVVRSIYESDLVIANLTNLNPNVMFELALRYSFGKPAIVIAEKNTKLPFDVIDENTVFYINDPKGADDLRRKIIEFEKNIDFDKQNYGPIYKAINKIPIYNAVESGETVSDGKLMSYVIDRLDGLERGIRFNSRNDLSIIDNEIDQLLVRFNVEEVKEDQSKFKSDLLKTLEPYENDFIRIKYNKRGFGVILKPDTKDEIVMMIITEIEDLMDRFNITIHDIQHVLI